MAKLYPPILEETTPAFYSENGIVNLTIPFSLNRAVSASQIGGFELKIKTLQSGTVLFDTMQTFNSVNYELEGSNTYVKFYFEDQQNKLKIGQFYKIQIAFLQVDELQKQNLLNQYYAGEITIEDYEQALKEISILGYYSDASIIKYTTKPIIYIQGLRDKFINKSNQGYIGCYEQITTDTIFKDQTEKVYSYRFDLYNNENILIKTSGDLIHNTTTDENPDFSQDIFLINDILDMDKLYFIQYSVTTTNKLSLSTPKYKIIDRELISSKADTNIITDLNFENGYITVKAKGNKDELGLLHSITGAFVLLRSDSKSNFTDWTELRRFNVSNQPIDGLLYTDYTVEQGIEYIYALQQYNDNQLYSSKICSEPITADFEDCFLFDGTKQLKIKYNMKMNKLNKNLQENKIDTIGSKYPYIFKNGNTEYKDFPIQGLISYFMDDEHLFMKEEELLTEEKTINYTTDNIAQERLFKTKVFDWLTDGNVKLFRSPTEGNFIVRLLKTSLSPEVKLGRLLHNFSCNAYEVADYTGTNLINFGFLPQMIQNKNIINWQTLDLGNQIPGVVLNNKVINNLSFSEVTPGERILITFIDGTQEEIIIGPTGNYFLNNSKGISSVVFKKRFIQVVNPKYEDMEKYYIKDVPTKEDENLFIPEEERRPIPSSKKEWELYIKNQWFIPFGYNPILFSDYIAFPYTYDIYGFPFFTVENSKLSGKMTFSFVTTYTSEFENIKNVVINDCGIRQFIGEHDILKELKNFEYNKNDFKEHPKIKITKINSLKINLRQIEETSITEKVFQRLNINLIHPFTLLSQSYFTETAELKYSYNDYFREYETLNDNTSSPAFYVEFQPYIIINGEKIVIKKYNTEINLSDFGEIYELRSGNGVVVEVLYQSKEIEYNIETTNAKLIELKETLDQNINNYQSANENIENSGDSTTKDFRLRILESEQEYLKELYDQLLVLKEV